MEWGSVVWGWVTSALGLVVVLLMAGELLAQNLWLSHQVDTVGSFTSMPLYLGGLVGSVLVVGGATAALTARRRHR